MKYYETELPPEYVPAFVLDGASRQFTIWGNLCATMLSLAVIVPTWLVIRPDFAHFSIVTDCLLLLGILAYMILHELVHGAAYWLMTRHKLTFGLAASVAYCGVPDIFTYRKTALVALLAPFAVFLPVFAVPMCCLSDSWSQMACAILLGVHVGGCVGDLYDTWLFLTRFRDPRTLMQDTGPKQTFYIPK